MMNSSIYILYSLPQSIYQYRQHLTFNSDNTFISYREIENDDSVYIDIPNIPEIIIISDIHIDSGKYEIIVDKRILRNIKSVFLKKYKNVSIRVYDIEDYKKLTISFDVTLAKKSIQSCL